MRIANLPLAIGHLKLAPNHAHNDASYSASDSALWKCLLGCCPVVPLEWNTAVRSVTGRQDSSNSLKAEVGAAGTPVQCATVPGRTPRASQSRRYGALRSNWRANSFRASWSKASADAAGAVEEF